MKRTIEQQAQDRLDLEAEDRLDLEAEDRLDREAEMARIGVNCLSIFARANSRQPSAAALVRRPVQQSVLRNATPGGVHE